MVKKSEKEDKKEIPISEDVPFALRRVFNEHGITDDKKIIELLRGK